MVEKGGQFCAKWSRLGIGLSGGWAYYCNTLMCFMVKVRVVLLKSVSHYVFLCQGEVYVHLD